MRDPYMTSYHRIGDGGGWWGVMSPNNSAMCKVYLTNMKLMAPKIMRGLSLPVSDGVRIANLEAIPRGHLNTYY